MRVLPLRPLTFFQFATIGLLLGLIAVMPRISISQNLPAVNAPMVGCMDGMNVIYKTDNGLTCQAAINAQMGRVVSSSAGASTVTLPFASGVTPVCVAQADGPNPQAGNIVNVQNTGAPTNASVTFQVTRSVVTLISLLGLNIGVVSATPGATTINYICAVPS